MNYLYPALLFIAILISSCAQQVSPTGGQKDIIPPNLISSYPANKTTNFKEQTISLTFDEYVVIDNLMQKLVITPETENTYTPRNKGQTVELKFRNPFPDSTTFTMNFGDGIKDFAERNPAQNLKLVFSTGPAIDSGRVYGTILDIRNSQPIFDALVGLYNLSDTLTPEKMKPYYFSRTDSSGYFAIENTQLNRYALIAITDKNRNLLYNPKEEQIAFLDSALQMGSDSVGYDLFAFHSDITPLKVQRTIPKSSTYAMVFNKGIDSLAVTFKDQDTLAYHLETPTQLKFYNVPAPSDTVVAQLFLRDSLGYETEIEQKIAFLPVRGKEKQTDPFSVRIKPEKGEELPPSFELEFQFTKPVAQFQADSLLVIVDSIPQTATDQYRFRWNTYRTNLRFSATSAAKDSTHIRLNPGLFISIDGDTLAPSILKFPVLKPENYGTIKGTVSNPSNRPFFIELLDKDYRPVATVNTSPFTFNAIKPGTYYLRLILDDNRNNQWDTGNYASKLQPESILFFPTPLQIKSNFEYQDNYFVLPE